MAKTGVVKKPFPYAEDGVNIESLKEGRILSFPDRIFEGLQKDGYIEESKQLAENSAAGRDDIAGDLNSRLVGAVDTRLMKMSDQELKDIIARSGTPLSGNLVHAEMVAAAKLQLVREAEGTEPVRGVDPNSGVTSQPLARPGEATPPSAAKAVEAQNQMIADAENKQGREQAGVDWGRSTRDPDEGREQGLRPVREADEQRPTE